MDTTNVIEQSQVLRQRLERKFRRKLLLRRPKINFRTRRLMQQPRSTEYKEILDIKYVS